MLPSFLKVIYPKNGIFASWYDFFCAGRRKKVEDAPAAGKDEIRAGDEEHRSTPRPWAL